MAVLAILVSVTLIGAVAAINSLKPCMNGIPDCIINPCILATCPNFAGAECRDWMCGAECKAEFWSNNVEVTSQCRTEQDTSSSNFLSSLLTGRETSNNVATADPVINTGSLVFISRPSQTAGGCPQGAPMAMCAARPCSAASCPALPNANCVDNFCGACNAIFYINGQDVTSQCNANGPGPVMNSPQTNGACPNGQAPVRCGARPCDVTPCPAFPGATCFDSYCGGCNAIFRMGQQEVTSQCNANTGPTMLGTPQVNNLNFQIQMADPNCPPGRPAVRCVPDPCSFSTCRRFPQAACGSYSCGGCFARFFLGGQEVTSYCNVWGNPQLLPYFYMGFPDMIGY